MTNETQTTQHTPAPWEIEHKRTVIHIDADGDATLIADIYNDEDMGTPADVAEANARLIAAAPKMLFALDACETALSPSMADHTCAEFPDSDRRCEECLGCMNARVWAIAAKAIAEARGQQS